MSRNHFFAFGAFWTELQSHSLYLPPKKVPSYRINVKKWILQKKRKKMYKQGISLRPGNWPFGAGHHFHNENVDANSGRGKSYLKNDVAAQAP